MEVSSVLNYERSSLLALGGIFPQQSQPAGSEEGCHSSFQPAGSAATVAHATNR